MNAKDPKQNQEHNNQPGGAFLQEVDELLQKERMEKIWKHGKYYIIAGFIGLFAGVGGYEGYKAYKANQLATQAKMYWSLTQTKDMDKQLEILNQMANADTESGYKALAKLNLASHALNQGETEKAIERYLDVGQDKSAPQAYADLGLLMAAQLQLETDVPAAKENLQKLVEAESPYRLSAQEFLAIAAEDEGNIALAKEHYERLMAQPDLTPDMRRRVQQRLDAINLGLAENNMKQGG